MDKKVFAQIAILFLVLLAIPSFGRAQEDPCSQQGIIVRNATMVDLWYKEDGGECIIWTHEHLLTVRPGVSIDIFSDRDCQIPYCKDNPAYKNYKSVDSNGNCRVRMLPLCNLSDM
ncbi:MAG TPA: hypothetical protein VFG09_02310 [Thermodesulfovibrionales bacterium]|jgi:hypothetical protein|nr:hypothetical protein [Thermodesulfovibrionales bacterium]